MWTCRRSLLAGVVAWVICVEVVLFTLLETGRSAGTTESPNMMQPIQAGGADMPNDGPGGDQAVLLGTGLLVLKHRRYGGDRLDGALQAAAGTQVVWLHVLG